VKPVLLSSFTKTVKMEILVLVYFSLQEKPSFEYMRKIRTLSEYSILWAFKDIISFYDGVF